VPRPVGKSEVRKSKPAALLPDDWISPRTRSAPRLPQSFATSKGTRAIVQPRRPGMRSSVAENLLLVDLFTILASQIATSLHFARYCLPSNL
jgi:hypothetical protein